MGITKPSLPTTIIRKADTAKPQIFYSFPSQKISSDKEL